MTGIVAGVLDGVDTFLAWITASLKVTTESYCDIETADSPTTLVAHDGSLISIIRIDGATALVGNPEFERLHQGITQSLQMAMTRVGHSVQMYFNYDKAGVAHQIEDALAPAKATAKNLHLSIDDLFEERASFLSRYCSKEDVYMALWTRPNGLTKEEFKRAIKDKQKSVKSKKIPPITNAQNVLAAFDDLRNSHDSFVRSALNDMESLNLSVELLEVHEALREMRMSVDPDFTDYNWRPVLPGDKVPVRNVAKGDRDISDILWPPLARQLMPRDAEVRDLRSVRIGDRIYSTLFIDLFPQEIKTFGHLFTRALPLHIPWRMSYLLDSEGLNTIRGKASMAGFLVWSSSENRLLNDSMALLRYMRTNTDEAIVQLKVALTTWAPVGQDHVLRARAAQLAKAVEGWGSTDVSEVSGDAFEGVVSTMLGVSGSSVATPSVAPLTDVTYMLPITRPASTWKRGALLFRSLDGKLWPFQPGSRQQTTWIDLIYARPGSGKSVLSNAINLALCLSGGIKRLPRIAIIDIGPSSSGLISLLKEALPREDRHLVAYHRLRMTPEYSINPFDIQLGCRRPSPQERAFLVNLLTLLATPLGETKPYDGIADMAGMVVDEMYSYFSDTGNPSHYTPDIEPLVDGLLEEIGFVGDAQTTWWEVTDALFVAGFPHEAMMAQRYAMPMLADVTTIVRTPAVEDLYGKITAPTGETLVESFGRMISAAIREYPILSRVTSFDIGDARIVSLDLDEVAKSGGEAADRQTAVMYMLARYVLAKDFYITEDFLKDVPSQYHPHHKKRIAESQEDPKRIVMDEFHRTSKAQAVRDQVILDMREGRKWNVQIALLSQSVDDFDSVMVEFATSIYILDAGPASAIQKSAEIFGLSETAQVALRTRVHGPREGGSTFLAQFATKAGVNMQLLTLTLGPIELWAFSTTSEDAKLRNALYKRIGPGEARRLLARVFPGGTATKLIEKRLNRLKEEGGAIEEDDEVGVLDELLEQIVTEYNKDPEFITLPEIL